ncbi:MAG: uracil-DNA glycosylase [Sedimentisphaerales bacterium]|nr:uracil-DNA glycosylase [Sedimentisphaerales bacterium]
MDPKKIAGQLVEMEQFFTGDFALKTKKKTVASSPASPGAAETDAQATLNAIAKQVRACRKCEISATRLNPVPGDGNPTAKLVFVGEAPGADEDQQGIPFVGRAGQLLEKMINAMGLQRRDVFICNILKCRPPGNRDPRPDEIYNCMPYLKKQLEAIRPEIIVALGAHAAKTLLDTDKPIGQLRGQFHEYVFSDEVPPAKLMPTYHPAYLLRNYTPDNRKRVWDDLQKVMVELGLSQEKR